MLVTWSSLIAYRQQLQPTVNIFSDENENADWAETQTGEHTAHLVLTLTENEDLFSMKWKQLNQIRSNECEEVEMLHKIYS